MALHSISTTPLPSPSHHLTHTLRLFSSGFRPFPHRSTPTRPNLRPVECTAQNAPNNAAKTFVSRNNGTVDYEKSDDSTWYGVYKAISNVGELANGARSVLDELARKDQLLDKLDLSRVIKALRRSFKAKLALQVCEWMNEKTDVYDIISGDRAIQLDLIAKVHGVAAAEGYFLRIPDAEKDNKIYGSLLNVYASAKMKDKAEHLREKAKSLGVPETGLQLSSMINLYMRFKDYDKAESLILELREKNLECNLFVYNFWLSCRVARGSVEGVEEVFKLVTSDSAVTPRWSTYSIMAMAYIKGGQREKAIDCLKNLETSIMRREKKPYHFLLTLYASVGKKADVLRIWSAYKLLFPLVSTWGYSAMISALLRLRDNEVEQVYEEWLATKQPYDVGLANRIMRWHIDEGSFEKAKRIFGQMTKIGKNPNASTWYIIAKGYIQQGNILEALACLKEAALISESQQSKWMPNPAIIVTMVELILRDADESSKDALISLLKQFRCWDNKNYRAQLSNKGVLIVGEDFNMVNKSDMIDGAVTDAADNDSDGDDPQTGMEMEESELLFSTVK